jgi:hypothetical protein
MLMVLSMALLVAPAMQHRLVECGNTSERLLRVTTLYAGASLVPLAISLALATPEIALVTGFGRNGPPMNGLFVRQTSQLESGHGSN